jgi:hypothetical protein
LGAVSLLVTREIAELAYVAGTVYLVVTLQPALLAGSVGRVLLRVMFIIMANVTVATVLAQMALSTTFVAKWRFQRAMHCKMVAGHLAMVALFSLRAMSGCVVRALAILAEWTVLFRMLCSSAVAASLHKLSNAEGTLMSSLEAGCAD